MWIAISLNLFSYLLFTSYAHVPWSLCDFTGLLFACLYLYLYLYLTFVLGPQYSLLIAVFFFIKLF